MRDCGDPRVRLVSQENAGVSAVRNRGVAEAKSECVAFLDADDEWRVDFLETVWKLRERFPEAGMWGTAYAEVYAQGPAKERMRLDETLHQHPEGLLINFFNMPGVEQPINPSSMMVRKDALLKVGGFMPGLVRAEDTDLLIQMALRYPIAYCPVVKCVYHMEADNRSDQALYTGNLPFFRHARLFLRECGDGRELGEDVKQYLARWHTGRLARNWLTGNYAAMVEIVATAGESKDIA